LLLRFGKAHCMCLNAICITGQAPQLETLHLEVPKLRELLEQTKLEPGLQGAFPYTAYNDILDLTKKIIDHHTLLVASLDLMPVRSLPITEAQTEIDNLLLLFYIMSKGLGDVYPPSVPDIESIYENLKQAVLRGPDVEDVYAYLNIVGMEGLVHDVKRVQSKLLAMYGQIRV
jgi:hypothetical protein